MMQRDPFGERVVCFLCDYGLILLAVLLIAAVAAWRFTSGQAASLVLLADTPTPAWTLTPSVAATVVGSTPTALAETLTPTSTPNIKPELILVFMPIAWQSDQASFEQAAHSQADAFIQESQVNEYFNVQVVVLTTGPENVALTDPELDYTILEFGLTHVAGDRYIGLTDADLAPDGESDIVGWTSGGQLVVAESSDKYVTAHELGHTFGLCDEYSYSEWILQNESLSGGCPNPYPSYCPQTIADGITCDGASTSDGRNSIMGPSGLPGAYGFNSNCQDYLLQIFSTMISQVSP